MERRAEVSHLTGLSRARGPSQCDRLSAAGRLSGVTVASSGVATMFCLSRWTRRCMCVGGTQRTESTSSPPHPRRRNLTKGEVDTQGRARRRWDDTTNAAAGGKRLRPPPAQRLARQGRGVMQPRRERGAARRSRGRQRPPCKQQTRVDAIVGPPLPVSSRGTRPRW